MHAVLINVDFVKDVLMKYKFFMRIKIRNGYLKKSGLEIFSSILISIHFGKRRTLSSRRNGLGCNRFAG